jgi:hypothetical protein
VGGAPWAPYLSSLKKKEKKKGKKINVLSRIDAGRKRRRDFGEEISQERRRQKMWPAVA